MKTIGRYRRRRFLYSEDPLDGTTAFTVSLSSLCIILLSFFIFLNSLIKPDAQRAALAIKSVRTHLISFTTSSLLGVQTVPPVPPKLLEEFAKRGQLFRERFSSDGIRTETRDDRLILTVPANKLFLSDPSELLQKNSPFLDMLAGQANLPDLALRIDVHTGSDTVGASPYDSNWEHSLAEASRLYEYFIAQGFDALHLRAHAHGEFKPAYSNDLEEGRRNNERVVFTLVALSKVSDEKEEKR